MDGDGGASGDEEAAPAAVEGLIGVAVDAVEVGAQADGHGVDLHEVFARAGCVDRVKCRGVADAKAESADFFAAGATGFVAISYSSVWTRIVPGIGRGRRR
jgi:hypothetical protein